MTILISVYLLLIALWIISNKTNLKPWSVRSNIHWSYLSISIIAGLVGGNTFVTLTGFSYKYGPIPFVFYFGVLLGLLVFHIFNKKITEIPQESIGAGLVNDNYPPSTQKIFIGANIVRFVSISLVQIIAGSLLLSEVTTIPYLGCSIILVASIVIYTYRHGVSGVIKTDMIQMLLVLIPLMAVTIYFFANNELVTHVNYANINYQEFGVSKSVLFGFFGFCFVIGSLEIWQRFARINSSADSLRLLCVSIVGLAITAVGIYVISAIVHINFLGDLDPNTVFAKIFSGTTLPGILIIPLTIAILSAILSTADTFIQGSATLIVKAIQGDEISSQKGVRLYKNILPVLGAILILVSNVYSNILSMAIVFANLVFAFTPLLLLLIFGLRPDYRFVNIGLLSSCIFAIVVGILPDLGLEYSYGTLMISIVFMAIGLIASKRKTQKDVIGS